MTHSTKLRIRSAGLVLICTFLAVPRPGSAAGPASLGCALPCPEAESGVLLYRSADGEGYLAAPLLHTDVELRVTGLVARARVTQRFANPTDLWLEGVYLFPLPELAAVDHLHMQIGERVVEGRIEERKRAEDRYRRARRECKKASLVAQQRDDVDRQPFQRELV